MSDLHDLISEASTSPHVQYGAAGRRFLFGLPLIGTLAQHHMIQTICCQRNVAMLFKQLLVVARTSVAGLRLKFKADRSRSLVFEVRDRDGIQFFCAYIWEAGEKTSIVVSNHLRVIADWLDEQALQFAYSPPCEPSVNAAPHRDEHWHETGRRLRVIDLSE